jgi:hypothetical protein
MPRRLALVLAACVLAGCAPGLNQSNGAKMGEALAFATLAGAAQLVESAAEAKARNDAPVRRAHTGVDVSARCADDQYGCVSFTPGAPDRRPPDPDLTEAEARDYVLGYLNGVRKIHGAGVLVRDETLEAFAQEGSDALAADHVAGGHLANHPREGVQLVELQGPPDGSAPGPLEDQLAAILVAMMNEGAGGKHHDAMLHAAWRRAGVGITHAKGRMYFTAELSE